MDLKEEILRGNSKQQTMRIAAWVGSDEKKFTKLMALFLGNEHPLTQRAAWAVRHCFQQHPQLGGPIYLTWLIC